MKGKWWRKIVGLGLLILMLMVLASAAFACYATPEEKIKEAEEELKQSIVEEARYPLHDNGKNLLFIEGAGWAKAMVVLQKWIDEHPCKEIGAISGADANENNGNDGWLVYYRDKANCSLTSTK